MTPGMSDCEPWRLDVGVSRDKVKKEKWKGGKRVKRERVHTLLLLHLVRYNADKHC